MFCKDCGKELRDEAVFCPNCGKKQVDEQQTENVFGTEDARQPQNQQPSGVYGSQQPAQAYQSGQPGYPVKPKKRHGCLIALLVFLGILAAAVVAVYFLVPGLLRPYDLGVSSSREAYESGLYKLQMTKDVSPETGEAGDYYVSFGSPQPVSTSLTDEEITSFFNENRPDYFAVKDVQVRVNEDGSIEASANLDTTYAFNQVLNGAYSREDAKSALPMLGLLPNHVNFYFKAYGSVVNNQIQGLSIEDVSVMGITIPDSLVGSQTANSFIASTLNDYIARMNAQSGSNYERIQASGGDMDFVGSVPSSVTRIPIG